MIKIENVSKQYKLGQIGGTTLREELQRRSAKRHGREDPTKIIGSKDYNKGETFMALDGVSFDVKKGERVGIIGHNGAGKSTLLKLLSRVTAPTEGNIWLNGRVASMLEVGTGFHGELTGRENIYMNGAILGMTKKEIDAKIEDIIEFSECRQFIDTPVKRYSSGMYVKLAFSVAAHLDSEIMIMDEVLAVGDMAFQKKCLEKMSDVSKTQGRTILYVSHNMNTIRQLCDRVIVLDHGKVVFDGDVEDGINTYLGVNSINDYPVSFDLSANGRALGIGESVRILSCHFVGKEQALFNNSDAIELAILLYCKKKKENLRILVKVYTSSKQCIGTLLSSAITLPEEEHIEATVRFSLANLQPGVYFLNLEVIEIGTKGYFVSFDNASAINIRLCLLDDHSLSLIGATQTYGFYLFNGTSAEVKVVHTLK